jgi:predicted PurR-regulated permease PerM
VKNVILIVIINQLKVALILIVLYSIVLYFLDFEYFFVYSVFFGLLTLVPIVGSIFSIILLAISCYIFDYSFHYSMKLIGVLFSGFLLENLILTPKLVGKSINTHPLMVLCGVIILPQFFGVFGLIFTLPIVAILNDGIFNIIGMIRNNEKRTNGQI